MMQINVKHVDKEGAVSFHNMPLKQYLQAKRVKPDNFFPGDNKAENVVRKIDMKIVPEGTTQKDVEDFERNRGNNRNMGATTFDQMLDSISKGNDISPKNLKAVGNETENKDEDPEKGFRALTEKDELPEILTDEDVDFSKKKETKKKSKFSKPQLDAMTKDQKEAIIDNLDLAPLMKKNLKIMKDGKKQTEQIFQLLGGE